MTIWITCGKLLQSCVIIMKHESNFKYRKGGYEYLRG